VEEFHGQFKIGGEKKKGVLLDWRGNEKKKKKKLANTEIEKYTVLID
jgi:hypothetical protein